MNEIFIPTLHSFENKNTFTGSFGLLRFKLTPNVEEGKIVSEIWHGILCFEKSEIEEKQEFPMTHEGREELLRYLTAHI